MFLYFPAWGDPLFPEHLRPQEIARHEWLWPWPNAAGTGLYVLIKDNAAWYVLYFAEKSSCMCYDNFTHYLWFNVTLISIESNTLEDLFFSGLIPLFDTYMSKMMKERITKNIFLNGNLMSWESRYASGGLLLIPSTFHTLLHIVKYSMIFSEHIMNNKVDQIHVLLSFACFF